MCVLRVFSKRKTLSDFLADARIPYYSSHDKNTPQPYGREKGMPFGEAGFQSVVSKKPFDDLPGQIRDAIRFLRRHKADLTRLRDEFKVREMRLDFPIHLRMGYQDIVVQRDYFTATLLHLAGELGIGIALTIYPPPRPEKKPKAEGER
jgi:hypothetical protein